MCVDHRLHARLHSLDIEQHGVRHCAVHNHVAQTLNPKTLNPYGALNLTTGCDAGHCVHALPHRARLLPCRSALELLAPNL